MRVLCQECAVYFAHEGPDHGLRFATLQGKTAAGVRDGHPELNGVDSVVWYERATETRGERVLVRSSAALAAARYMGGVWRILAAVAWWVPRPLRDGVYRVIARHRHRLVRNEMCLLPTEEQRVRFIE